MNRFEVVSVVLEGGFIATGTETADLKVPTDINVGSLWNIGWIERERSFAFVHFRPF